MLDPRKRNYQVGDRDKVIVPKEASPDLVEVEVVGFDDNDPGHPRFKVVSDGPKKGEEVHDWQVVFT